MDVIKNRNKFYFISLSIIIVGIIMIIINSSSGIGAFNYDVDFTGGTSMEISINKNFDNNEIASIVKEITGDEMPQIQSIVGKNQVNIKTKSIDSEKRVALFDAIKEKYELSDEDLLNVSDVSAAVSDEMKTSAFNAIIVACIAILIYITFRFKSWKPGLSAVIALLHDALIVVSFMAIFRITINYSFIAAILTVLGYSINATIVVFDRIRENFKIYGKKEVQLVVNKSILQSTTRCIYTSITTLTSILLIYFLGVNDVKLFTVPIIIGIIAGTYSSMFLAGTIMYNLESKI